MEEEKNGKMTAHKGCTLFEEIFLEICLTFSESAEHFDECLHTVLNVCRGLILSVMNLRLLYASHELLYTPSLSVKKSISY